MLQAGVEGVVSALHHVPTGDVWTPEEIARRQAEIGRRSDGTPSGIAWEVVESLPVSEDIKKQKGDWREHLENYRVSLRNLAAAGIEVVCYNFMPVLDWTRTDLAWRVSHGGTCMRFDYADFAAFDIHILAPQGRRRGLSRATSATHAARRFAAMDETRKTELARNVVFGLPGSAQGITLDDVRAHLAEYGAISPDQLRAHFIAFLEEVIPTAEEVGIRMCCHPDDPPFPLLGLPRVVSTEADYRALLDAVDQPGQRRHPLLRLARRAPRQRPARHDAAPGRPGALPAPAQRHARVGRDRRLLLRGRASRRRHRHGGADRRRPRRGAPPRRRRPRRTSRSPSAPTTARTSSTT